MPCNNEKMRITAMARHREGIKQDPENPWRWYEYEKARIAHIGLTPQEYDKEINRILGELNL